MTMQTDSMTSPLIKIKGGKPLYGSVRIQGSKNAALPILAACLMIAGVCRLENCPFITDVYYMQRLLECAGCHISRQGSTIQIDATQVREYRLPGSYVSKMRSSVVLMGALLSRMGEAEIEYPGGCVIGERPIDLHLMALERLGAEIQTQGNTIHAAAKVLRGCEITFPFSSVGATQNAILAAVLAKGETVLHHAAREPEVTALCSFLTQAGAQIQGTGTATLVIQGVEQLHETTYRMIPDRIVAGTYLFGAMAAGGEIVLEETPIEQMQSVFAVIESMGGELTVNRQEESVKLCMSGRGRNPECVETGIYPAFPTDLQSPLLVAACMAQGHMVLRENIFSSRFKIVEELRRMGADITLEQNEAMICGNAVLEGRNVIARELRGGAALVIAGVAAGGFTSIADTCYIRRGYEDIVSDFAALGAAIGMDAGTATR